MRYLPAAEQAQVGGDWYDAFMGPDKSLTVVVGDVAGHDRRAVAAIAQIRNLTRGVSDATQVSPARVLTALDEAMHGLSVGVYATAILARIELGDGESGRASHTLRWSNAGHPPPLLIAPDGDRSGCAVGVGRRRARRSRPRPWSPGQASSSTRTAWWNAVPLQEGLEWLLGVLDGHQRLSAEELCDHLIARSDDTVADDVALLVLRRRG